jgi:hypothetical protein
MTSLSLSLAEASVLLAWRRWFPEQGKTAGVTLRAASEVNMKAQEMVHSIIVNAIQFALQPSQKASGQPGEVILSEEQVSIARAVIAALSEQGFQVTRVPSEPR